MKNISANRIRAARFIAVSADVLQMVLFPLFAEGFVSVLDDALDVLVCGTLTMLVGWHFSFLPSFVVKVIPLADLVPTWTIAVFLATRRRQDQAHDAPQPTEVYADPPHSPQLK